MSQSIRILIIVIGLALPIVAFYPASAQVKSSQSLATFEKLLELVELKVNEEILLKLIEETPVTFTLGKDQIEKLKKAGATDKVLEALRKKAALANSSDIGAFVIILDASNSMNDEAEKGTTKWQVARQAALDLLAAIPAGREVAFIVYGTDHTRKCEDVTVLRPMSAMTETDRTKLSRTVKMLSPQGHTPIALSLRVAGEELAKTTKLTQVILITDGMETCHGDPNKEAAKLTQRKNLRSVDVIGLGLNEKESQEVAKIAKSGRGNFYDARTVKRLQESVKVVLRTEEKKDNADNKGWVQLFNGQDLKGWKVYPAGTGKWEVKDGVIHGSGPVSHLYSERGDYKDFHFRVEARINDRGNSGQYFRTKFEKGSPYPTGYEAQINVAHTDPVRTGSLYPDALHGNKALRVKVADHKPDEWFTQEVICKGNHIVIKVNGKTTVDWKDPKAQFKSGHFALQQHDAGTKVQFRKVEVKELPEEK